MKVAFPTLKKANLSSLRAPIGLVRSLKVAGSVRSGMVGQLSSNAMRKDAYWLIHLTVMYMLYVHTERGAGVVCHHPRHDWVLHYIIEAAIRHTAQA